MREWGTPRSDTPPNRKIEWGVGILAVFAFAALMWGMIS